LVETALRIAEITDINTGNATNVMFSFEKKTGWGHIRKI
jgi:hypothetical protein